MSFGRESNALVDPESFDDAAQRHGREAVQKNLEKMRAKPKPRLMKTDEAKSALAKLVEEMERPESAKMIKVTLQQLSKQLKDKKIKPRQLAEARYTMLYPVLNRIAADVSRKYGFDPDDGFTSMLMSIQSAASEARDSTMMQMLLPIRDLVTGTDGNKDAREKGRIPELDPLVSGFALRDKESQEAVLKAVEDVIANKLTKTTKKTKKKKKKASSLAFFYVESMKSIMSEPQGFLERELERISKLLQGGGLSKKEETTSMKHVQILSAFFSPKEMQEMMAKMKQKAEQVKQKGGQEVKKGEL
jgi:hypothetical protein